MSPYDFTVSLDAITQLDGTSYTFLIVELAGRPDSLAARDAQGRFHLHAVCRRSQRRDVQCRHAIELSAADDDRDGEKANGELGGMLGLLQ